MRKFGAAFAAIVLCLAASFTILSTGVSAHSVGLPILSSNTSLIDHLTGNSQTVVQIISGVQADTYEATFTGSFSSPQKDTITCTLDVNHTIVGAPLSFTTIEAGQTGNVALTHVFANLSAGDQVEAVCFDTNPPNTQVLSGSLTMIPQN